MGIYRGHPSVSRSQPSLCQLIADKVDESRITQKVAMLVWLMAQSNHVRSLLGTSNYLTSTEILWLSFTIWFFFNDHFAY